MIYQGKSSRIATVIALLVFSLHLSANAAKMKDYDKILNSPEWQYCYAVNEMAIKYQKEKDSGTSYEVITKALDALESESGNSSDQATRRIIRRTIQAVYIGMTPVEIQRACLQAAAKSFNK